MPLGKRTDYGDAKYAGLVVPFTSDVEATVQDTLMCGFDFVVAPLVRPDHRPVRPSAEAEQAGQLSAPFARGDVLYLGSSQWNAQVVGHVSAWIDPDSPDPELRRASTTALRQELSWAAHLGLQAVILPPPPRPMRAANYAQVLQQALNGLSNMALWLTVPMAVEPPPADASMPAPAAGSSGSSSSRLPTASEDPWEWWHQVRTLCDSHALLGVILRVPADLPPVAQAGRWYGEPVKALLLPTGVFSSNKRGYPVLSKAHQDLVASFFRFHVQVVVEGECRHTVPRQTLPPPAAAGAGANGGAEGSGKHVQVAVDGELGFTITDPGEQHPLRPYWEYLCFTFRRLETLNEQDRLEATYKDYLQAPLQPLQDNLESSTYETFEKDVTKYQLYEEAVYKALLDIIAAESPQGATSDGRDAGTAGLEGQERDGADGAAPDASSSGRGGKTSTTVLMVVGAGRGPLVRASMQAGRRAGRALKVYAVEKNPNAIVHIDHMLRTEGWTEQVTIVSADMRHWVAPELADVLVSELLGSFGDNELSPECLDGAQRFLKREGGISIPQNYTSFLAPVTSHKLYNDVRNYRDLEHFETPYVVRFHRHHLLARPKPVFVFNHPNWESPIDNSRYDSIAFERDAEAGGSVCHGFAGYFESVLYGDVLMSTHPPTHTPGMFSWFPIFFPLREPVYLPPGAPVEAALWRCVAPTKVWYEWALAAPVAGPIHNVGGRSYWVGL